MNRRALFATLALLCMTTAPASADETETALQALESICLPSVENSESPSLLAEGQDYSGVVPVPQALAPTTPLSRAWRAPATEASPIHVVTAPVGPPATPFSCMITASPADVDATIAAFTARLTARGYVENVGQRQQFPSVTQLKFDRAVGSNQLYSVLLVQDTRGSTAPTFRAVSFCIGCFDRANNRAPIN